MSETEDKIKAAAAAAAAARDRLAEIEREIPENAAAIDALEKEYRVLAEQNLSDLRARKHGDATDRAERMRAILQELKNRHRQTERLEEAQGRAQYESRGGIVGKLLRQHMREDYGLDRDDMTVSEIMARICPNSEREDECKTSIL